MGVARPSARRPDRPSQAASAPAAGKPAVRSKTLIRADRELPDGRYLLAYSHVNRAAPDA